MTNYLSAKHREIFQVAYTELPIERQFDLLVGPKIAILGRKKKLTAHVYIYIYFFKACFGMCSNHDFV